MSFLYMYVMTIKNCVYAITYITKKSKRYYREKRNYSLFTSLGVDFTLIGSTGKNITRM